LLVTGLLAAGCEDRRRHQASEAVALSPADSPVPPEAPPIEVARATLTALADAQRARAAGLGGEEKKRAYERALSQACALAARKEIHEQVASSRALNIPRDITEDAAVNIIVESWISSIAHYCDGIVVDTLRIIPDAPQTDATAQVEAHNPRERERLATIEAETLESGPKGLAGDSAGANPAGRAGSIRDKAVAQGFNYPEGAGIEIRMRKLEGGWKVTRVTVSTYSQRPRPTTIPAVRLAPTTTLPLDDGNRG
jgi:hypothetical protein